MDSYTLATYINDECKNDNVTPFFTEENVQRIIDYQKGIITTVSIPDPANPQNWVSGYPGSNANIDCYGLVYSERAFTQEHNISASGGANRFTFYMGFGYLDQSGLLKIADDSFKQYTPTGTIEAQMTDWMKLRYTVRYIRRAYSRPTYWTQDFFNDLGRQGWAVIPYWDDNGIINNNSMIKNLPFGGRTDEERDVFNNHGSLILEPLKNWVTTVEVNYNTATWTQHAVKLQTYRYDVFGNSFLHYTDNYVADSFTKDNFLTLNAYSSYRFSLNERHNFSVMAGMQAEDMKTTAFGLSSVGVMIPDLPVMDLTNGLDPLTGEPLAPSVNGNRNAWNTAGFFGRLNYDYQGRYLLEANLRYDGTSRFRTERRWNWSPSVSAGWNIARESFWDGLVTTVNMLKLRGSYGRLGNQNTDGWYPTYQVMDVRPNEGAWLQNGAKPNIAYSPELISAYLTWEKIYTANVGVDAGAFNNRLTVSFDYYVRKTLDMVGPAMELPVILGKAVPRMNNTDLKTQGFELVLGWQDRLKNGLTYSASFLLSDSRTTILRYPNFTKSLDRYYEGQIYGNIWGYETIGIARTPEEMQAHLATLPNGGQNTLGSLWAAGDIMYRDLNGDGKINAGSNTFDDPGDRKIIGNSEPRYLFGLDLNAAWKGFDLRIFFQGVGKRDHFTNTPLFFGISVGGFWHQNPLKEHADYFREEPSNHLPANLNAYYPRPLYNNYTKNQHAQTRWLQNAAFIRLKNISLGYTIPQDLSRKFFVNQLRVFVTAENIWTGTKMATMFDPESMCGMHFRGDGYPLQKLTSFGINVTF